MFDNIGRKIKGLAQTICWIGIVAAFIIGMLVATLDEDFVLGGILIMVLGSLFSWIGSFFVYGFGQLIENTDIIAQQKTANIEKRQESNEQKEFEYTEEKVFETGFIKKNEDGYFDISCPTCGEKLSFTEKELSKNEFLTCPFCNQLFATSRFQLQK